MIIRHTSSSSSITSVPLVMMLCCGFIFLFFGGTGAAAVSTRPTIRTCYLIFAEVHDLGYSYSHNLGRRRAFERFLHTHPTCTEINHYVTDAFFKDHEAIIRGFVQDGCDVIFATAPEFGEDMLRFAQKYPNVTFAIEQGFLLDGIRPLTSQNVVIYGAATYENWYVMGFAAALEVDPSTNCVGFISAWDNSFEVVPAVNAFILGVQSVNKNITVHVVPMQNWGWEEGESLAVRALHNLTRCRVYAHYTDKRSVPDFVRHSTEDLLSLHIHTSGSAFFGDSVITSSIKNWDVLFHNVTATVAELPPGMAMHGELFWGADIGLVSLDDYSPRVKPQTRQRSLALASQIQTHDIDVYCNRSIVAQNGTVILTVGDAAKPCLSTDEIRRQDYHVLGHVMHERFQSGYDVCGAGQFFEYVFDGSGRMILRCFPCEVGTASLSPVPNECPACPVGVYAFVEGSTLCSPESSSTTWSKYGLAIVLVGSGLVLVVVALSVAVHRRSSKVRSVRNAPTTSPCTVMFTDVVSSTRLWATHPLEMAAAMDMHHRIVRGVITEWKCYEVKTIGDAFMIAGTDPMRMTRMACDLQVRLQAAAWPQEINVLYEEEEELHGLTSTLVPSEDLEVRRQSHRHLWNGLRVRVALHWGDMRVQWDPVVKGFDYYGANVAVAARVLGYTQGGQILVTQAISNLLAEPENRAHAEHVIATETAEVPLRGLEGKHVVVAITPVDLAARRHRPLSAIADGNADLEFHVEDGDEWEMMSPRGSVNSSHADDAFERELHRHPLVERGGATPSELADHVDAFHSLFNRLHVMFKKREVLDLQTKVCRAWRVPVHPGYEVTAFRRVLLRSIDVSSYRRSGPFVTSAAAASTALRSSGSQGGGGSACWHVEDLDSPTSFN
eukprot:PhM_4_TR4652/c0_g1_i1/m.87502